MPGVRSHVRVVLCDDAAEMRARLRGVLEDDPPQVAVVGEAGDALTAVHLVRRLQPDVVLLDVSMPGLCGIEAIALIHAVAPHAQVVVFSGYAATEMAPRALARNACSYVEKGEPLETVRAAVLRAAV